MKSTTTQETQKPLISVIVPVYGTEKWLRRCLDSIIWQSYRNIELICVNDASPDGCAGILEEYANSNPRIPVKVITHDQNKGLFAARLSGIQAAKGEYIAFVDSDDYVSCDWFRPLIKRAVKTNADIVLGNIIEVDENGWKHYSNICRNLSKGLSHLYGRDVYKTFMSNRGSLFYWHVMWNKIYRKSFFDQCVPYYDDVQGRLTMTEDIAFSCVLYAYAKNVQLVDNDCYFYCRHKEASTSTSLSQQKIIGNLKDVIKVFAFFKKVLEKRGIYSEVENDYLEFRAKYFRIWCNSITVAGLRENKEVVNLLLNGFEQKELSACSEYEFHLNSLNTTWDDRFEKILEEIRDEKTKVVSFDVFDTLVKRPLWVPEDVKYFVQYTAGDILAGAEENTYIKMRTYAEQKCREMSRVKDESKEDVTLEEIYAAMGEIYGLSSQVTDELMHIELEVEQKFIMPRAAGKRLFDVAKAYGKKIIIVSDMYMREPTVKAILEKCGYSGYSRLYMSSEYGKLKYSGNLFRIVLREMKDTFGIAPGEILHIGDTWQNDIIVPRGLGMRASFLAKAVDVFTGNVGDIYNGNCTSFMKTNLSDMFDTRKLAGQLPIRSMYAVIANNYFDDPFNSFQKESRFNGDPYFMGYFGLGTYLFGVAKWIYDVAINNGYEKIAFIARDGFIVKKIFDEIVRRTNSPIESDYIYATRKSVLPYVMDSKEKFYAADNFVNVFSRDYTYLKFLQLFAPVTHSLTEDLRKSYLKRGIVLEETIGDTKKFNHFIAVFIELSFDEKKAKHAKEMARAYYSGLLQGKCATFDVGYSGRIQKALSELCGHPIDALFLHDNGQPTAVMAKSGDFSIYNYYDFNPLATDILRETFISENSPSCIGLQQTEEGTVPLFAEHKSEYLQDFAIDLMQRAALQYAKDFLDAFADYLDILFFRNYEAGYLFEYLCTNVTEFDKFVFINHRIEDQVYSGFDGLSLVYRWNENLQEIAASRAFGGKDSAPAEGAVTAISQSKTVDEVLSGKSRIKKALFYWLFDKETFKYKLKERKESKRNKRK